MWHFLIRQNRVLFLSGIIGLMIFFSFWGNLPVTNNSELSVNRKNAIELSHQYLDALGFQTQNYHVDYKYSTDEKLRWYLVHEFGKAKAGRILAERSLGADGWEIRLYQKDSSQTVIDSFELLITPIGKLKNWYHQIPDDAAGEKLNPAEAVQIAYEFIRKNKIIEPVEFQMSTKTIPLKNRTDYFIRYTRSDSTLKGEMQYVVAIHGNHVAGFSQNFAVPTKAVKEFQAEVKIKNRFRQILPMIFICMLIWLIYEFTKYYHIGYIELKNIRHLLLFCLIIFILETLNAMLPAVFGWNIYETTKSETLLAYASRAIFQEDIIFLIIVILGFLIGTEYLHDKNQTEKLLSMDAALSNYWISLDVAHSLTLGFFSAGSLLGLVALLILAVEHYSPIFMAQESFHMAFDKFFPWLTPLFSSLESSLIVGIGLFLFLFLSLIKYIKSKFVGIFLIPVIIAFGGIFEISFYPWYFELIFNFLLGLAFLFIFIKYDFLTTLITIFIFGQFAQAFPLLNTTNAFFVLSGFSASIVGFACLFFAFLGFRSNQKVTFTEKTLPSPLNELIQQERLLRELEIARSIQHNLLPKIPPQLQPFDVSGMSLPAREVSGNFFDFIQLDPHRLGLVICEISAKGMTAAFNLSLLKGVLRGIIHENITLRAIMEKINKIYLQFFSDHHQLGLFIGILDADKMTYEYINSGSIKGFCFQAAHNQFSAFKSTDFAWGRMESHFFEQIEYHEPINLEKDDFLMVFTTGFAEAENKNGEIFGMNRLQAASQHNSYFTSRQMILNLVAELEHFTQNRSFEKDLNMIVVKVRKDYSSSRRKG